MCLNIIEGRPCRASWPLGLRPQGSWLQNARKLIPLALREEFAQLPALRIRLRNWHNLSGHVMVPEGCRAGSIPRASECDDSYR